MEKVFVNFFTFCHNFCSLQVEELDYYHQKVNIQVVWRVVERLNIKDYGKLENVQEIPEILGIDGKVLAGHHSKGKF